MTATAFDARVDARAPLHPLRALLLAGAVSLFLGVLLSDIAYADSDQVQWKNFASWLNAGALVLCNLSASNVLIGKADERAMLCASQSGRCLAAYVFAAAAWGESTTDLAWDGQGLIHELGVMLACTERFADKSQLAIADVDVERLRLERMRTVTFNAAAAAAGHPEASFRRIAFTHRSSFDDHLPLSCGRMLHHHRVI